MSKSRGNVINPDDVVLTHGADALRLYEMFMGPLEAVKPWQTGQLAGVVRFRDRVFHLVRRLVAAGALTAADDPSVSDEAAVKEMHKVIKKVSLAIDTLSFNTAISALMVYTTYLMSLEDTKGKVSRPLVESLILLLSPFAPHVAEECWELIGHTKSLAWSPWPVFDEQKCLDSVATIAIQVNGKMRLAVDMDITLTQEEASALALQQPMIIKYTQGKDIKKTVYVPGKIINFFVK